MEENVSPGNVHCREVMLIFIYLIKVNHRLKLDSWQMIMHLERMVSNLHVEVKVRMRTLFLFWGGGSHYRSNNLCRSKFIGSV